MNDKGVKMESIISNCIFGYQCEKSWEELTDKEEFNVKHCNKCDKDVHFCPTPQELMRSIREGLCVAVNTVENDSRKITLGYPSSANFDSFLQQDES